MRGFAFPLAYEKNVNTFFVALYSTESSVGAVSPYLQSVAFHGNPKVEPFVQKVRPFTFFNLLFFAYLPEIIK